MAQKTVLSPEQDIAATPTENVWVQANAGTGKTSVLVQRLLRILFRTNLTKNTGILCLTYTNAGASEMRNRILAALRGWAIASDDDLHSLLDGISVNKPVTDMDLQDARNIFYKYIDNPDILKVKTIHGFCEEILRRFPIEAGIPPTWNLISGANQEILLSDTFHKLINSGGQATVKDAFTRIIGRISEHSFDELLEILTTQYKQFFKVDNFINYRKYFIDNTTDFLLGNIPIKTDISAQILTNIVENAENDIKSAKKPAGYMVKLVNLTKQYIDKTIDFNKYKTAYLTADCTKIANISKKDYLVDEQERVYQVNQYQLNDEILKNTIALFDLSSAFAKTYQSLKSERNLLDFDDLILYTQKLFSRPDTMGWVLSQLDLSLNHILVDEAQDTSPEQWDILRMISGDFFTDGDTAISQRSLFVVGDSKQSIYGFQGADPAAFASSRKAIAEQIENNFRTIREVPLTQSFRSTAPILAVVDFFFGNPRICDISGFVNNTHKCFRGDAPGSVEIYKLFSKSSEDAE